MKLKICGLKQLVNHFVNVINVLPSVCERNAYDPANMRNPTEKCLHR